jgi:TolB protein
MFRRGRYSSLVLFTVFLKIFATSASPENVALRNIKQITFPEMGFEKAGESYFSPDSKTLMFQAVPTGKTAYQIYAIDIDSGGPRLISTGRGACTCAFFRSDGKKIIFASSHDSPENFSSEAVPGYQRDTKNYVWDFTPYMNIYEANLDGSGLIPLTSGSAYHAECAYSSDGSHIVFASNVSGSMNIYTMKADGSEVQQITDDTRGYNGGPFISPDGSKIVYRADYDKRHYLQIYCIDRNGKNRQQLTKNGAVNWAPFWHPNGKVIAFTTSLHGHSQYEIYLLNIETGASYRLTYGGGFNGLPSFNKEGTKITWTSKRGPDKTCQIFVADFIMPDNI